MKEHMENVKEWISEACSKPGFSDAHIDRFEPAWRERSRWIEGGISILQEAEKVCAAANCNYKLALVFTLKSGIKSRSVDFEREEEFQRQLDHSPPSVFIAEPGSEPWITSRSSESVQVASIPERIIRQIFPAISYCQGLLMEYRPNEKEEPSRTVWLLP
jgi:hypothetical protein